MRAIYLLVAAACYAAFFVAFVYLVGFVGGYPALPSTVDKGVAGPVSTAVIVDLLLIALFGLQHSVMARPGFKASWTRIVPVPLERGVYCLAAALVLGLMYALWRPIDVAVWSVDRPILRIMLWVLFAAGWIIVFISTWLISHFELFGVAQAWRHWRRSEPVDNGFRTPFLYRAVRHPIYAGFMLAFWATPEMSAGHLLLALGMSAYMLIGIRYEERDLVATFGATYEDYRRRVGMLVPGVGRRA